jgi:hypothetical protein
MIMRRCYGEYKKGRNEGIGDKDLLSWAEISL